MSYSDAIAESPNTPPHLLTSLSRSDSWLIRRDVAENPNTPLEVLIVLSQDRDYEVRWSVARNPNTSYGVWIPMYGRTLP